MVTDRSPKGSEIERLVLQYRRLNSRFSLIKRLARAAEWLEGHDERLAVRGVYSDLGENGPTSARTFFG